METGDAAATPTWRKIVDFPLLTMLIAVAIYVAAGIAIGAVLKLVPLEKTDVAVVVRGGVTLIGFLLAYKLAIRHLGAVKRDDLALDRRGARQFGGGLLFGALLFAAVVGVAALLDVYNVIATADARNLVYAAVGLGLIPGLLEEMLFRGILFRWLEEFGGSWFALALTSALFGLGHAWNPNATAFSSFAIAVEAGVLLGGAYMLTRSLWFPVGLHAAWNFTQGEIFDVPVSGIDTHGLVEAKLSGPEILSGGSFGLEASLIALVLATAAGVWLLVKAIRYGELVRPYWVRRRLQRDRVSVPVTADA